MGEHVAARLLTRIEQVRLTGRHFLLGCPTGRTPRPILAAMGGMLASKPQDLSHVAIVMMDEYLVRAGSGFEYVPPDEPWSCHYYVREEIRGRFNRILSREHRLRADAIWFPHPDDPAAYDARIGDAGGLDCFVLASGASDGHVGFNPPGSPRESRTRIIALSDETRRDNLATFPSFGTLDAVPHHGISVGIDTIAAAKEAVMIVWGTGKRTTLSRMLRARQYDPEWPATVIHECAVREIVSDEAAATP